MKKVLLATANKSDGRREIHLVTNERGERLLSIGNLTKHVPLPTGWSDDDIKKFATWVVNRETPVRDTMFELMKELGSTHVQ